MSWVQQHSESQPPQPLTSSTSAAFSNSMLQQTSGTVGFPAISSSLNTLNQQHLNIHQQHRVNSNDNQPTRHKWQQANPNMINQKPNATAGNNWQQQSSATSNSNTHQHVAPSVNNWAQPDLSAAPIQQQQQQQTSSQQQTSNYAAFYSQPPVENTYVQQHNTTEVAFGNYQQQKQPIHQQRLQQPIPQQQLQPIPQAQQLTIPHQQQQQPIQNQQQQPISQQQQQQFKTPTMQQQNPIIHQQQPILQHQQQPIMQQQLPITQQQQQPTAQTHLQNANAQNYFDNNSGSKSDGWGDWDWNDNSNINNTSNVSEHLDSFQLQQQSQKTQLELQQQSEYNANYMDNSFRIENSDNWQWSAAEQNANQLKQEQQQLPSVGVGTSFDAPTSTSTFQQPQVPPASSPQIQQQHLADISVATVKATTPTEAILKSNVLSQQRPDILNENFNDALTASTQGLSATTANVPSSVYVSQAKPVSKPSRQYASPPAGTPTEVSEFSAQSPPQAFKNDTHPESGIFKSPATMQSQFVPSSVLSSVASTTTTAAALPPPPAMTPPAALPPIASNIAAVGGNPFKRAGAAQHHRSVLEPSSANNLHPLPPISPLNFVMPPPPADFATPIQPIILENIETDNSEILHENQEVIVPANASTNSQANAAPHPPPNDERNQYLQTSHLSENPDEELNIETDNFPPPGLSRLVLGQPELEASQRMVTGTDEGVENMNIDERHADGEDTSIELPPLTITMNTAASAVNSANNIAITTDRNLYMVPGESNARSEQRVVTGVERIVSAPGSQIINEQREIELDGENLEDQQMQQQQSTNVTSRNEPPLEGAAASNDASSSTTVNVLTNPTAFSQKSTNAKDLANISTGNDESDQLTEQHRYSKSTRKHESNVHDKKSEKQRKEKQRSVERYESDDSEDDYPSEHERDRRRNYREGSIRSERDKERDHREKKNRRDRELLSQREKQHHHERNGENGGIRSERRSQRYHRYDADSKYETEESTRHEVVNRKERRSGHNERERVEERSGRSDRSERDYDNYRRYHQPSSKREGKRVDVDERRDRRDVYAEEERRRRAAAGGTRRGDKDYRVDYDNVDRRNRRSEKHRGGEALEYEEYRKQSSRNARESDIDKERRNPRGYDPRHAGIYGGYQATGYGYDPYTYYYEQMARTNPQAYAEWYKKYYGHAALTHGNENLTSAVTGITDGRESVHSGRSSANNDRDRLTHAYISQANEYHRHFMHHQQQQQQQLISNTSQTLNSTMLEEANVAGSQSSKNYIYNLSRGRSTGNLSQDHATTTTPAAGFYAAGSTANLECSFYARSDYADSRSGNLSLRDAAEPQRLTPCKFINDHAVVSFSAGLLITVKPKYTPNDGSNIVKLLRLGANDTTRQLFQSFPGPLVRGLTHKKTIIEFCEDQIRLGPSNTTIFAKQLLSGHVDKFKASFTLMWNLLILLLRQNGMVVGTDIAELLLRNQEHFPYIQQNDTPNTTASNSIKTHSKSESDSNEDVDIKESDVECDVAETATKAVVTCSEEYSPNNGDDSAISTSKSITAATNCSSEEEITVKFRNYLLYGNVNEALDWATDNNLWGHALFLASKVDRRSHANVMMKFANKLSLNDPLQTLYQLMSGRTPSSVTSVQDEKWGDWRPHLSMILSNTSQKPELDRKAITTLGDSLFNRGDLYAAHFCYLMAQVGFGRYNDSASQETTLQQSLPKLVLLGSSHYKCFKEFATNEAIIMTEIYEYACSLNDEKFSLVELQPYKYLMATRMLDYGYQLKSLMYMEQISLHIERDPSKFDSSFINKVYEIADRLKFYDPVLEKTMDEPQNIDGSLNSSLQNFEEQKWLQVLRGIAAVNKTDNAIVSGSIAHPNYSDDMQENIKQQFAEINKQFSELNMQYKNNSNSVPEAHQPNAEHLQQQMPPINENIDAYTQQQAAQQIPNHADYVGPQYNNQSQQVYTTDSQTQPQEFVADSYANYGQQYMQNPQHNPLQQQYYDPTQQQPTDYNAAAEVIENNAAFDYWGGQQQQQQMPVHEENSRPTISMPNAKKSYDSDGADDQQNLKQQSENIIPKKNRNDGKDASKSSQPSNQNSGWFGGIWNKLSLKPKNQMILPDDKNPAIVWDSEKKRWVNTDGAEDVGGDELKPPPKMSELMPQQPAQQHQQLMTQQNQQPQISSTPTQSQLLYEHNQYSADNQMHQQLPAMAAGIPNATNPIQTYSAIGANVGNPLIAATATESAKPPSLQSNMFKMQRNRTLKNSYVDVFNPSGAPMSKAAENVLAPALPPAAVPQGGFFIPGAPSASNDAVAYQQQQNEPSQDLPQFYNPNQFGSATGNSY